MSKPCFHTPRPHHRHCSRLRHMKPLPCTICSGAGRTNRGTCNDCNGTGQRTLQLPTYGYINLPDRTVEFKANDTITFIRGEVYINGNKA